MLKLFLVLLLFYGQVLRAGAESQSQRVSLSVRDVKLKLVLDALESQTHLAFFYSDREVDVESRVSVKAENEFLSLVLGRVFGPGFSFEFTGDIVVIKPLAPQFPDPDKLKVSGVVSAETVLYFIRT